MSLLVILSHQQPLPLSIVSPTPPLVATNRHLSSHLSQTLSQASIMMLALQKKLFVVIRGGKL